jgi:hypothetical protein
MTKVIHSNDLSERLPAAQTVTLSENCLTNGSFLMKNRSSVITWVLDRSFLGTTLSRVDVAHAEIRTFLLLGTIQTFLLSMLQKR